MMRKGELRYKLGEEFCARRFDDQFVAGQRVRLEMEVFFTIRAGTILDDVVIDDGSSMVLKMETAVVLNCTMTPRGTVVWLALSRRSDALRDPIMSYVPREALSDGGEGVGIYA